MSGEWLWPGARWWRCDLHVHSPSSHDFRDGDASAAEWIQVAEDRGVEVIAVTDHDAAGFVTEARLAAGDRIVVLAGVELTSSEGVHLIVLLGDQAGENDIRGLLGACGVPPNEWGKPSARAEQPLLKCVETASSEPYGALCLLAHADAAATESNPSSASFLRGAINDRARREVLGHDGVVAVEISGSDMAEHRFLTGLQPPVGRRKPGLPLVEFSDAHSLDEIGRRTTLIKMTRPSLDGLRLAFADGQHSVRGGDDAGNDTPAQMIESITVEDAKLAGRAEPFHLGFNPWLSAIIGGRGSGKSTVVNLLRAALDRTEAPGTVGTDLNEFLQVPTGRRAQGALTAHSKVTVVYRKDGVRFRSVWTESLRTPTLEEMNDAGEWAPADGSVRVRLPVQIFGQGEIHETARRPRALLDMINEAPELAYADWLRSFTAEVTTFYAVRAQARQARASLPDESETRGELQDVERGLAAFEAAEHQEILRNFQKARREQAEVLRLVTEIEEAASTVRAAIPKEPLDELASSVFNPFVANEEAVVTAARRARTAAQAAFAEVRQQASELELTAAGLSAELEASAWRETVRHREGAYRALLDQLHEAGVESPDRFAPMVERRQQLLLQLQDLEARTEAVATLEAQSFQGLAHLQEMRRDLSRGRRAFLQQLLEGNQFVHIELEELADTDDVEDEIRELLGVEVGFGDDVNRLVQILVSGEADPYERLRSFKERVLEIATGDRASSGLADARFAARLSRLSADDLDRVSAWFPQDALEVSFNPGDGQFRALAQGSTGQRNAAILAFVFSYGSEPIVIDQPENDLDNRLIAKLVVEQMRQVKPRRQVIVVSHNPNIVVNADADLIAALHIPSGQVLIEAFGGLQEEALRTVVCDVMEGGRDALESRYSRIAMRSSAR